MAILVPAELDLGGLQPESERNVIRQLLNGLDDDWYIVPKVPVLIEGQNAEIDVVLVSPHLGVVLLEIKGGLISVRDGVWCRGQSLIVWAIAEGRAAAAVDKYLMGDTSLPAPIVASAKALN